MSSASIDAVGPRRSKARRPLGLLAIGWALSGCAIWADTRVSDTLRQCRDSAGTPLPGMIAAWAGPVAAVVAVGWIGVRLVTGGRPGATAPYRPGARLLAVAVIPAAVLLLPLQGIAVSSATGHAGPQRSPCFGAHRTVAHRLG